MHYALRSSRSMQIAEPSTTHPVRGMNDEVLFSTLLALLIAVSGIQQPQVSAAAIPSHSSAPLTDGRKSIIIHPDQFAGAARAFAFLHREFGGIEAELVTLSAIRQHASTGPSLRQIPFAGWDQRNLSHGDIRGYDAATAKKIIAFLQGQAGRTDIAAVLLLGDGAVIPPATISTSRTSTGRRCPTYRTTSGSPPIFSTPPPTSISISSGRWGGSPSTRLSRHWPMPRNCIAGTGKTARKSRCPSFSSSAISARTWSTAANFSTRCSSTRPSSVPGRNTTSRATAAIPSATCGRVSSVNRPASTISSPTAQATASRSTAIISIPDRSLQCPTRADCR